MGLDQPSHWLIVLVILVLLFGSAKLPKLAKSLGESMRIFKGEAQKMHSDDSTDKDKAQEQAQAVMPQPVQQQLPPSAPAAPSVTAQPSVTVQMPDGSTVTGVPVTEVSKTSQPG
jgi:sec-independent protein translocase protein TatA